MNRPPQPACAAPSPAQKEEDVLRMNGTDTASPSHTSYSPATAALPPLGSASRLAVTPASAVDEDAPGPAPLTFTSSPHRAGGGGVEGVVSQRLDDESFSLEGKASAPPHNTADFAVAVGASPPLHRPSLLFHSAMATDALFARMQQPSPSSQPLQYRPGEDGGVPAPRRSVGTISSVLGRPPPAPPSLPGATAVSGDVRSYPSPLPNRVTSASSSSVGAGGLRSPSPTSTTDYVEIEHKQNELRNAVEHHVHSLERSLALRDEEVAALSSRLRKLEEDYQFNYNLIAERDAALEEASTQLQRLYRELRRLTDESTLMEKKVESVEQELKGSRQRVREVEEERDAAVRQVQKDYVIKERHLLETMRAKEAALEREQTEQHAWYKEQSRLLEEERAAMADRNASASIENEERLRHQLTQLQSDMTALQQALREARQSKAERDRQIVAMEEAHTSLVRESALARERHEAEASEAELSRKELEERLVRAATESEKRLAAVETSARGEAARASRLELECTRLQAQLAEAQERLQHLTSRFDDDVARFTKERQEFLKSSDDATAAAARVEQTLHDTERELEKQRRVSAEEVMRLRREVERAQAECELVRQELVVTKEGRLKEEAQVQRLEDEVRQWKSEEGKTASQGRQECTAWEEKCRCAERQVQLLQEEAQQAKKLHQGVVERAQSESLRLTRELHASEAARRALETQFHLQEDVKEGRDFSQVLRSEKEQLQKRVAELENTNAEIRAQIANFTAELQNDPVIKAAKETHQRAMALQLELTQVKAEQQLQQDTLKEKEEELVRCQTELLRVQVLLTSGDSETPLGEGPARLATTAPASLSDHISHALQRQQQQMRSEYSRMRESYEEMVRELDRQQQRRHCRRRAMRSSRAASVSASSSSSSSSLAAVRSRSGKPKRERCSGQPQDKGERLSTGSIVPAASPASVPPALPDSQTAYLLQESEVWRQRSLQLEQQLHAVLRERDRLKKELQLAKQDVTALGAEKSSLVDLNSLLKAQLREAYRLRVGDGISRQERALSPSPAGDARLTPHLLAAALHALETSALTGDGSANTRGPRGSGASGAAPDLAGLPIGNRASTTSRAKGTPWVNSTAGSAALPPSPAASTSHAQERLATLEKEIQEVREQLSISTAPTTGQQQQRQLHPAIVRRGQTAVRHYGLGG